MKNDYLGKKWNRNWTEIGKKLRKIHLKLMTKCTYLKLADQLSIFLFFLPATEKLFRVKKSDNKHRNVYQENDLTRIVTRDNLTFQFSERQQQNGFQLLMKMSQFEAEKCGVLTASWICKNSSLNTSANSLFWLEFEDFLSEILFQTNFWKHLIFCEIQFQVNFAFHKLLRQLFRLKNCKSCIFDINLLSFSRWMGFLILFWFEKLQVINLSYFDEIFFCDLDSQFCSDHQKLALLPLFWFRIASHLS